MENKLKLKKIEGAKPSEASTSHADEFVTGQNDITYILDYREQYIIRFTCCVWLELHFLHVWLTVSNHSIPYDIGVGNRMSEPL